MSDRLTRAIAAITKPNSVKPSLYEEEYCALIDIRNDSKRKVFVCAPPRAGFDTMIRAFEKIAEKPTQGKRYAVAEFKMETMNELASPDRSEDYQAFWDKAIGDASQSNKKIGDALAALKPGKLARIFGQMKDISLKIATAPIGPVVEVGYNQNRTQDTPADRAKTKRQNVYSALKKADLSVIIAIDLCDFVGNRGQPEGRAGIYQNFIEAIATFARDVDARVYFLVRTSSIMNRAIIKSQPELTHDIKLSTSDQLIDLINQRLATVDLQFYDICPDDDDLRRLLELSSGNTGYLIDLITGAVQHATNQGKDIIIDVDIEEAGKELAYKLLPIDRESQSGASLYHYYFGKEDDQTGLNPLFLYTCFKGHNYSLRIEELAADQADNSPMYKVVKQDGWLSRAFKEGWIGTSVDEYGPARYVFSVAEAQPNKDERFPSKLWLWPNELLTISLDAGKKLKPGLLNERGRGVRAKADIKIFKNETPEEIVMPDFLSHSNGSNRTSRIATLIELNRGVWIPNWVFMLPELGGYEGMRLVRRLKETHSDIFSYEMRPMNDLSGIKRIWYRFAEAAELHTRQKRDLLSRRLEGRTPTTLDVAANRYPLVRPEIVQPGIDLCKAVGNDNTEKLYNLILAHEHQFIWGTLLQRDDVGGVSAPDTIRTMSSFTTKEGRFKSSERIPILLDSKATDRNTELKNELWQQRLRGISQSDIEFQLFVDKWANVLPNDQRLDFLNGSNGWYIYSRRFAPQGQV